MPYTPIEKRAARAATRKGLTFRKVGKRYELVNSAGNVIEESGRAPVRFIKSLTS